MGIIKKTVHFSAVLMLQARRMTSMTGTWLCLRCVVYTSQHFCRIIDQTHSINIFHHSPSRKNWTSGQRFPLCSAAWSATLTSPREPRSMRRRRALWPHVGRPPRLEVRGTVEDGYASLIFISLLRFRNIILLFWLSLCLAIQILVLY